MDGGCPSFEGLAPADARSQRQEDAMTGALLDIDLQGTGGDGLFYCFAAD